MKITKNFIFNLPKTDLHCHLDGSIRTETLIELAKLNHVKLPSYDAQELIDALKFNKVRSQLVEYLKGFEPLVAVAQDPQNLERISFELVEDAASENITHLEIRYCPYLFCQKGLSNDDVISCITRGVRKAQELYSISVGQILCGLKHESANKNMELARIVAKTVHPELVGFDFAGPEINYPLSNFQEECKIVRGGLKGITLHAGENTESGYIKEALTKCFAERIGHGTSLKEDGDLLNFVTDKRIAIETCPSSNLHTGSVKDIKSHPIKEFLNHGVRVCVNTDNRLVSQTTITNELYLVCSTFNLSLQELKQLITNGFKAAFVPYKRKQELLEHFLKVFQEEEKKLL